MAHGEKQQLPFKEALFCFFVSIATILGTGILALPVKLYECGFAPFVITFLFSLLAQTGVVWLMVEILQRADHRTRHGAGEAHGSPSLHGLAALYLTGAMRYTFNISAMVHFISLLIGYVLAWSKAFCQMAGCTDRVVITPFVIVFTVGIVLFNKQLQPLVTTLTFIKCVMLIVMVGVVGYIGSQADIDPSSSWPAMGAPFLIGTLALGGVVNVMPVLYERIPKTPPAVRQFRSAVTAGVVVCWILNILWAYFILQTVPMSGGDAPCHQDVRHGNITLECAHDHDEISTQPLVDVIKANYHRLLWLGQLVASFILLSITVSYLTIGNAMKHMIDGYSRAHPPQHIDDGALACLWRRVPDSLGLETAQNLLFYFVGFGLVYLIAIFNPKSFLLVLEVVTSLALNIEAGAGIGVMFAVARSVQADDAIPTSLSPMWDWLCIPIILFFLVAVGYDIVTTLLEYAGETAAAVVCAIAGGLLLVYVALKLYYRSCTMEGIIGRNPALMGHARILNEEDDAWAVDSDADTSSSDGDSGARGGSAGARGFARVADTSSAGGSDLGGDEGAGAPAIVELEDRGVFEVTLPGEGGASDDGMAEAGADATLEEQAGDETRERAADEGHRERQLLLLEDNVGDTDTGDAPQSSSA